MKRCSVLILLCFSVFALAQTQMPAEVGSQSAPQVVTRYCPSAEKLIKKEQWWGYGNWRSYDRSFVTQIRGFVGAQWVGVGVGTMICIYQGTKKTDFPLTISDNTLLVKAPQGGSWGPYQQGRKNCIQAVSGIQDCPFQVVVRKQPKDIYKALDFFKGRNQNNS